MLIVFTSDGKKFKFRNKHQCLEYCLKHPKSIIEFSDGTPAELCRVGYKYYINAVEPVYKG